jgi:hypothetical protein
MQIISTVRLCSHGSKGGGENRKEGLKTQKRDAVIDLETSAAQVERNGEREHTTSQNVQGDELLEKEGGKKDGKERIRASSCKCRSVLSEYSTRVVTDLMTRFDEVQNLRRDLGIMR